MAGTGEPVSRPAWTRPIEAVSLVARGRTARVAVPVAAVVGTIVSLVNQGDVVLAGQASGITWVRVAINYLVPYIVASVAYLSACRSPR
jgi:C4-dicarboxylate transporter